MFEPGNEAFRRDTLRVFCRKAFFVSMPGKLDRAGGRILKGGDNEQQRQAIPKHIGGGKKMKNNKLVLLFSLLLTVAVAAAGCGGGSAAKPADSKAIKVGVVYELTG